MKVYLFITGMGDIMTSHVGQDTVEMLERFGCEGAFPV